MTTPSDEPAGPESVPVPVRVVLLTDRLLGTGQQEVVARLWKRRQFERRLPNLEGGSVARVAPMSVGPSSQSLCHRTQSTIFSTLVCQDPGDTTASTSMDRG
ncbi:hypothetical protein [Streptomyces sp. NPDC046862]|uniref:hypothetical protein n=1 Tax=Streptomyces sp. NPDC046862 TaxID=3154603 RepID=UPI003452AE64